jgi:hypothetical protein
MILKIVQTQSFNSNIKTKTKKHFFQIEAICFLFDKGLMKFNHYGVDKKLIFDK